MAEDHLLIHSWNRFLNMLWRDWSNLESMLNNLTSTISEDTKEEKESAAYQEFHSMLLIVKIRNEAFGVFWYDGSKSMCDRFKSIRWRKSTRITRKNYTDAKKIFYFLVSKYAATNYIRDRTSIQKNKTIRLLKTSNRPRQWLGKILTWTRFTILPVDHVVKNRAT